MLNCIELVKVAPWERLPERLRAEKIEKCIKNVSDKKRTLVK